LAQCPSCGRELQLAPDGISSCPECAQESARRRAERPSIAEYFLRFPATTILLAINILVFVAMLLGHVSLYGPTTDQLVAWGGNSGEKVLLMNQWWRILTAAFIHIGIVHLVMNMWALWVLGTLAEVVLGPYLYLAIYLTCAISGALASLYANPVVAGAGASGALMGVLGALISVLKFAGLPLPSEVLRSTIRSLVQGAALTLLIGVLPRVDNAAHIGGLMCGLIIGLLLSFTRRADRSLHRPLRQICVIVPVALMVPFAFAVQKHGQPEVRLQYAFREIQKGHYANAEKNARVALEGSRNRSAALLVLSEALALQGHDSEASNYLHELVAQDARNESAVNRLAAIELKDGDTAGALDLLRRTLPLQPRNAEGQVYLGRALQAENEDREAIEHYRKAVEINPNLYEAQLALAGIYEKNNQLQDALLFYLKAAQLRSQELDTLRGLARVYLALGFKKQADQTIEQIRTLEATKKE